MRQKKDISEDELSRLKAKGWSHQRLANHFSVSPSTIRRRLKTDKPKRDEQFMEFTQRLVSLAAEAPIEYCKKELLRLVHSLRVQRAMTDETKRKLVADSLATGALEREEIAEDCKIPLAEIDRLLELMVAHGSVEKSERGGVQNRGRRKKYHYRLLV